MTGRENRHLGGALTSSLIERRMTKFMHEPPTVRAAAGVIVTATALIVVLGGVMMRVLDHPEYRTVWIGMWWVLQTVTTVGYGDYTPKAAVGRILTSFVMLYGIAFLSIITAAITSVFVARAEQERITGVDAAAGKAEASAEERFDRIDAQLADLADSVARLEKRLGSADPPG
jgi:voltage-gated potassium channel